MKWLIWLLFGVLAALWTGGAWLIALVLDGVAGMAASAQVVDIGQWLLRIELPSWVSYWIEVHAGWTRMASDVLNALLKAAGSMAPTVAAALSWLSLGVWLCWGLGMVLMLALAGGLHVLVGRAATPTVAAPPAA